MVAFEKLATFHGSLDIIFIENIGSYQFFLLFYYFLIKYF